MMSNTPASQALQNRESRVSGRSNARLAVVLLGIPAAMGVLVYYSVPLYQLFCQVTGYGGTTQVAQAAPTGTVDQEVTVRFDANVAPGLAWEFIAPEPVKVRLGEEHVVSYKGKNIGSNPSLGTATSNVVPYQAGAYFNKIECFCFTEQLLLPGEQKEFTLKFFVDPSLMEDADTSKLSTITLSYTFFNQGPDALDRYMGQHKISYDPSSAAAEPASPSHGRKTAELNMANQQKER